MYYEVHGSGEPVVLLHGEFMTITNNWTGWIGELSKTRKVIAIEMQGHGTPPTSIANSVPNTSPTMLRHARLLQDPKRGPHRIQHGWRRRDAVCDPPSGQSEKGGRHFVHVPP